MQRRSKILQLLVLVIQFRGSYRSPSLCSVSALVDVDGWTTITKKTKNGRLGRLPMMHESTVLKARNASIYQ
jgi:hypothetical protein